MTQRPPPTRKAQKAATREALKTAALEQFAEAGFPDTSIAAITHAAGVAHGTFYVHYPSKEALLDELLVAFNTGLVDLLLPIWIRPQPLPLPERVRRTAETFLGYWEEHRGFVEVYAQKVAEGLDLAELRDGLSPEVAVLLTGQLATLAAEHDVDLPAAQLVVQGLLAMWGRIGLQVLFNDQIEPEQALETLVEMTLGAMGRVLPVQGVKAPA